MLSRRLTVRQNTWSASSDLGGKNSKDTSRSSSFLPGAAAVSAISRSLSEGAIVDFDRQPQRHRQPDLAGPFRWLERAEVRELETGALQPAGHVIGRDAEPAMGMLLAQEFQIMRRKVDDEQPPAGVQYP